MAGASTTFHEDEAKLKPATIERHRAIISLMEELEAVDWYDQRVDATRDPQLKRLPRAPGEGRSGRWFAERNRRGCSPH